MTSSTSAASTPARDKSSLMTTAPSSCAGVAANAPLKEPTAVRAALAMTMESDIFFSRLQGCCSVVEDFSCPFPTPSQTGNRHGAHAPQAGRVSASRRPCRCCAAYFACYAALCDPALHKLLGIMRLLRISSKRAQSLPAAYSGVPVSGEDADGRKRRSDHYQEIRQSPPL